MQVQIGIFLYALILSCSSGGHVAYPVDDYYGSRIIAVCSDYGPEQAYQEYVHEVVHACIHNHHHHFDTKEELAKHLGTIPKQNEEAFVSNLAACVVPVLEKQDVSKFLGLIETDSR